MLAEQPRETIAAGSAPAIHEHRFRTVVRHERCFPIRAIAHTPVVCGTAGQQLDETIRDLTAGVPTFIDDQAGLGELRPELPVQLILPINAGVRDVDVPKLATTRFFDPLT